MASAGLQGDYLELGVLEGHSLVMAYQIANRCQLTGMRFLGFDSFQGLPGSERHFKEGTYKSSPGNCIRRLRRAGVDLNRIAFIEGIYSKSLNKTVKDLHNLRQAAIVHIDCDLYTSTKDALVFVEDLIQPGTIIIFDDWHAFDATATPEEFGEQRAFLEWPLYTHFRQFYDASLPSRGKAFLMEGK